MSRLRKWQHAIGLGLETTFGTAVAPSIWMPGKSTLKGTTGVRKLEYPVGEWEESRYGEEPAKVSGGLTFEVAPGRSAALRALTTRATDTTLQSATVYDVWGARKAFVNTGLCAKTVELSCAKNEILTADLDCVARLRNAATAVSPNYAAPPAPYIFKELRVILGDGYENHCETAKAKWDFQLDEDDYRADGTGLVNEFPTDGGSLVITLDHIYEHHELWEAARARTEMVLALIWRRGATTLTLSVPRVVINDGMDIDEEGKQPLELKAYKPTSGGAMWTWEET